jgi:hypothetical protein
MPESAALTISSYTPRRRPPDLLSRGNRGRILVDVKEDICDAMLDTSRDFA